MGTQEGGYQVDFVSFVQPLVHPQLLQLILKIQAIAGLGFGGGDTVGQHFIQESPGLFVQLVLGSGPGLAHGVQDAAAGSQDVQIGSAPELQGDLALAVAAENHVGVAVDETGGHQSALGIDDFGIFTALGQDAVSGNGLDQAIFHQDRCIVQLQILALLFAAMLAAAHGGLQGSDIFNQEHRLLLTADSFPEPASRRRSSRSAGSTQRCR